MGGESSGAGIEVPSVSEKLIGASVNGLNLVGIAAVIGGVRLTTAVRSPSVAVAHFFLARRFGWLFQHL